MLFLAFLSVYAKLCFLSRKFSISVICLPIIHLLYSKTPPSADGVAERQCCHSPWRAWQQEDSRIFFIFRAVNVSRVPYLAPLKKIQGRSFFAFYSSLLSQNIFTGLRHKAAQNSLFPLNFFPKGCFSFRYATDTDRLRKRERWKKNTASSWTYSRSLSLPHQKRAVERKERLSLKNKNGRFKPVFSCLSEH